MTLPLEVQRESKREVGIKFEYKVHSAEQIRIISSISMFATTLTHALKASWLFLFPIVFSDGLSRFSQFIFVATCFCSTCICHFSLACAHVIVTWIYASIIIISVLNSLLFSSIHRNKYMVLRWEWLQKSSKLKVENIKLTRPLCHELWKMVLSILFSYSIPYMEKNIKHHQM